MAQTRSVESGVTLLQTLVPCSEWEKFCRVASASLVSNLDVFLMRALKSAKSVSKAKAMPTLARQEVRCAVRFPLILPAVVSAGKTEINAHTRNISASGALFELDRNLETGQDIRFSLRMPGSVLGTPRDVLVHCLGRVVRCCISQTQYLAAATIDEYKFAEQ